MAIAPSLSSPTLADADRAQALAAREAVLDRREAALREAAQAREEQNVAFALASSVHADLEARLQEVELRERELAQARGALGSQRDRLAEVQAEYESRREALTTRAREVDAARERLREEQARLVSLSLELERRLEAASTPGALRQERQPMTVSEREWWSKQLGTPLEAA